MAMSATFGKLLDQALNFLRDVLLAPVWSVINVDKDSLTGLVVQGLAGALASALVGYLLWLVWYTLRALRRIQQAAGIRNTREAEPNAVLILIADFAGKGREEKWGDELAGRLEEDFAVFAPGSAVRAARWAKTYKGNRERALRRARKDVVTRNADLIMWGQDLRGDEVLVTLATSDTTRPPVRLAFGPAKTEAQGTGKLTREVGDAIAFFAAEAAGKVPAGLNALTAAQLVALAEKLAALIQDPPRGLTPVQQTQIAASFDRIGVAAAERAFPSGDVAALLEEQRFARAQASGLTADWQAWGDVAVTSIDDKAGKSAKLQEVAEDETDPSQKAAILVLLGRLQLEMNNYGAARATAEKALAMAPERTAIAGAKSVMAAALAQLAIRSDGEASLELSAQAAKFGEQAVAAADPSDFTNWINAHLSAAQALRFVMGGNPSRSDDELLAQADALLTRALTPAGQAVIDAPRPAVQCDIERCELLFHASQFLPELPKKPTFEKMLMTSIGARRLVPKETYPLMHGSLTRTAARALLSLGTIEQDLLRLSRGIEDARQAASELAGSPGQMDIVAWSDVARGMIARAEVRLKQKPSTPAAADAAKSAAHLDIEAALNTITERIAPVWGASHQNHNAGIVQSFLGRAHRFRAEIATTPEQSARDYLTAASHFRSGAEIFSAISRSRVHDNLPTQLRARGHAEFADELAKDAAACENLAAGARQSSAGSGGDPVSP